LHPFLFKKKDQGRKPWSTLSILAIIKKLAKMEIYKRIYFKNIMKVYFSLIAAFLLAFGLIFFSSTEKAKSQGCSGPIPSAQSCYDASGANCPNPTWTQYSQTVLIASTSDPSNFICPVTINYVERDCFTNQVEGCPNIPVHELFICSVTGPDCNNPSCSDWCSLLWKGTPPTLDVRVLADFYVACYMGLSVSLFESQYSYTDPLNQCQPSTEPCHFPNPYCRPGTYEFFIPSCMGICYQPASHNPPRNATIVYKDCPAWGPAPTCCGYLLQFCWCQDPKTGQWNPNRSETLFSIGMPLDCPKNDLPVCPDSTYIPEPDCVKMCPNN
jgi:hypothetical protein